MGMAEDGVAAPGAGVWAAARGDEGDRALPVVCLPRIQVQPHVDGIPIRPRLRGQVFDLRARRRKPYLVGVVQEGDAVDLRQLRQTVARQMRD